MSTSKPRSSPLPESNTWDGKTVALAEIGAPVAVCTRAGEVVGLSPRAGDVLQRVGIDSKSLPFALPDSLWADLSRAPDGEAIEWRGTLDGPEASLGCTKYELGGAHSIVLMREVSAKRRELSRRLHRQRLESTGRLVASIAHDVRTAVASIVYNADFLSTSVHEIAPRDVAETANEIHEASRRLESICAGLLGFAKLGPPVLDDVALQEVVTRV